jgi:hypothetical protein
MDDAERLAVALRLKAARYLSGHRSDDGRAVPMPIADVIALPGLRDNRMSRNRLEEIEQMKTDARPMELAAIADAMNLPAGWFGDLRLAAISQWLTTARQELVPDVQAQTQGPATAPENGDEEDRPGRASGGGGA